MSYEELQQKYYDAKEKFERAEFYKSLRAIHSVKPTRRIFRE